MESNIFLDNQKKLIHLAYVLSCIITFKSTKKHFENDFFFHFQEDHYKKILTIYLSNNNLSKNDSPDEKNHVNSHMNEFRKIYSVIID